MKKLVLFFLLSILIFVKTSLAYKMEMWVRTPFYVAGEKYNATQDYSNTQGYRNWYYQYSPVNSNEYFNMEGYGRCWEGSSGIWAQPKDTCCLCLWQWGGHPHTDKDAVRSWKAPYAGNVTIYGSAKDGDVPNNDPKGNGVKLTILKNDNIMWTLDLNGNDNNLYQFIFPLFVNQNDYIRFRINAKGDAGWDNTQFESTIEYSLRGQGLVKVCQKSDKYFTCEINETDLINTFGPDIPDGDYYVKARTFDDQGNLLSESDWSKLPLNRPPQVLSVNPNSGTFINTITLTFEANYTDPTGIDSIQRVYFAISPPNYKTVPDGNYEDACCRNFEKNLTYYFAAVYYPFRGIKMVAYNTTDICPWQGLQNTKGTARLRSVSHIADTARNVLSVKWEVEFINFETGNMNIYLMAVDNASRGNDFWMDPCYLSPPPPPQQCCIATWKKMGEIRFYSNTVTTTTVAPPGGSTCFNDQDCPCYAICLNGNCFDFRNMLRGCNYYDNCPGNANCCASTGCDANYCVNAEEQICEDPQWMCHGYFQNCGAS